MTSLVNFFLDFPAIAIIAILVPALAFRWFLRPSPADRRRTELFLIAACLVEPVSILAQLTANRMSPLRPVKYDLYVYCWFDRGLGSPSFRLGQEVWKHAWLHNLVSVSYGMLPVMLLVTFACCLYLVSEREAGKVALAFCLLFFSGSLVYLILPVSGPVYAFSNFPAMPPASLTETSPLWLTAPPNAVPSGHTGAALLTVWFLRRWKWGKAAGVLFLLLTVLATLGSGQHYLFDLVVAVPYARGVVWAVERIGTWNKAGEWKEQEKLSSAA